MKRLKHVTVVSAVALAAVMAQPAFAQEDAAGATTANKGGLGEIVVTAQRRSENLQNVPIAITAADSGKLATARVENISTIQSISPSITVRSTNISSSTANVIIRGLGTTGNSRTFEGSVGIFIDGVYRTRAAAALQNFLDVDNLQILRGPQGTLFGKNTTAGALLISSAKPKLDDLGGMIDASYGNYDTYALRAAVNVPIADVAAVRVAGLASGTNGFYKDATTGRSLNDDKTRAVKGQLLVEPSPGFSIRLIGDYSRGNGNCCYATSSVTPGPTQPLIDALTLAGGRKLDSTDLSAREVSLNGNGNQVIKDYGSTLLISAPIGSGTLNSVTALRRFTVTQSDMDPDFSGADLFRYFETFDSKFFSQELTYNIKIPVLNADAVFGAFYSNERLHMTRQLPWASQAQAYWDAVLGASGIPAGTADASPGLWAGEEMLGRAKSYAGFAHFDFAVTDKFNVIAGLRYSVEEKRGAFSNTYYRPQYNDVFKLLGVQPGPAYDQSTTDRALSGTFGLQYKPNSDTMLYATYNRGFKAGGVNIDANGAGTLINNAAVYNALPAAIRAAFFGNAPAQPPLSAVFKPEKINAFEVGAKFQYLNRRARTNIALFYYDISDLQVAQFIGLRFTVLNANRAKDYGVEIENSFQLTDSLNLSVDGTWIPYAKYAVDPNIDPALSGSRFRYAPKLTGNVTLLLDQPLTDTVDLTGRLQYQYASSQLINTAGMAEQGAVSLFNANLGFKLPERGVAIDAFVTNLFDKTYFTAAFNTPLQTGDVNGYLGRPRTFGIRFHSAF